MLLVNFKRSKRMRYFHGNEKNELPKSCVFKHEYLCHPPPSHLRFAPGGTFFLVMASSTAKPEASGARGATYNIHTTIFTCATASIFLEGPKTQNSLLCFSTKVQQTSD